MRKFLGAAAAILLFGPLATATVTSVSIGDGSCSISLGCSFTAYSNTFAGNADFYRDWFAFNIPSGAFTSATIQIWSDPRNSQLGVSGFYNLYDALGINYYNLNNGPVLGHISDAVANNGFGFVSITLNADGLLALNANQGGHFIFGGVETGPPNEGVFGYTQGLPEALLILEQAPAITPEPSSVILFGTGLVAIILFTRKMLSA